MNFQEAREKAEKLSPQKASLDLFKFIRTIEGELAQYNKANIYLDSEDVEGKPIGFYSRATEIITQGRKKEGQPFNLYETGEFLDNLFAKVDRDSVFFDTKDEKKPEVLSHLLSKDIFGLQDDDLRKALDELVLPFFLEYFRKELF